GVRTMAIVRWALIGLMALAAVASIVYYFGGFHFSSAQHSGTQYYCPMHPSIVQDHPGECPICSMTLVPRDSGKAKTTAAAGTPKMATTPTQTDAGAPAQDGGQQQGAKDMSDMPGMPGMQAPEGPKDASA